MRGHCTPRRAQLESNCASLLPQCTDFDILLTEPEVKRPQWQAERSKIFLASRSGGARQNFAGDLSATKALSWTAPPKDARSQT